MVQFNTPAYAFDMANAVKKNATYQDVVDAPPHMSAELIDSELFIFPRPAPPHANTSSAILSVVFDAYQIGRTGPGGWWIHHEPELHVGADVLIPDIGGWLRSEVPEFDPEVAHHPDVPTWVCEVLSPSTERHDRGRKLGKYLKAGVAWMWLVNPLSHTIEVLHRVDSAWVIEAVVTGDGIEAIPPFSEVEIDLSWFWLSPTDAG